MSSARFVPTPGTIADLLRRRLLDLDYPAFARCACRLLDALGYEDARPAGRREWKGYNRPGGGGYDLEALLPGGLAPRRVVAQIKQFDALAVHQRSVDELRGACLRAGAAEALLVTTSAFSDVVRRHAASPDRADALGVPVHLIDGQELLGLLIRHRLGVRESDEGQSGDGQSGDVREWERGGTRRLALDEAFFESLAGRAIRATRAGTGKATDKAAPATATPGPGRPSDPLAWRVTVLISGSYEAARGGKGRRRSTGKGGTDTGDTGDAEGGS